LWNYANNISTETIFHFNLHFTFPVVGALSASSTKLYVLQVYLTGMVPLAIGPSRPQYVDFNDYYVPSDQVRRFADKAVWRDSIFSHLGNNPELLMQRLWQCVEASNEGRTPPSLDDLVEQLPTSLYHSFGVLSAWLLTCFLLVIWCFRIRILWIVH